jgi:hypothetical protein
VGLRSQELLLLKNSLEMPGAVPSGTPSEAVLVATDDASAAKVAAAMEAK